MGAEAYTWITKYKENLADALENARQETFAAGKFLGAEENPATIEEAMELDPEGGSGSLLEIIDVSETPELLCACRLSKEELLAFFGTERPSHDEIMQCMPFWESFDRGEARAIVLYENDQPATICFAGWTLDNPAFGNGSFEDVKKGAGRKKKKKAANFIPPSAEERAEDLQFVREFMKRHPNGITPETMEEHRRQIMHLANLIQRYEQAMDMDFFREIIAIQNSLRDDR